MLITASPYENAKYFLYRVLPWAPLGDPTAVMNVHWTYKGEGFVKPAWSGQACQSIDECIKAIQYAQKQKDTRDIYVALGSMRTYEEKVYGGGFTVRKAIRSQENVVQLRCLWIDLDVELNNKSGKAYPTKAEAAKAFAQFCLSAGLPRPSLMVASGSGGFHVYWTLDQALTMEQWKPLAFALAEATRRFGLICDSGCTVDAARILRIPDTLNKKSDPPNPVVLLPNFMHGDYALDQIRQVLSPFMGAQVLQFTPKGNAAPGLNDALGAGISAPKAPPIDLDTVAAAGCGFVANAIATGGKDYANPLWNLTTLLATFTAGGREDAHRMAKGHPSYSEAETDALYSRKEDERAKRDLGWPSCAGIENNGCTACATCPLKAPGTKPLQFGYAPSIAPTHGPSAGHPDLPKGYTRAPDDRIRMVQIQKDGTSRLIEVMPYPLLAPWLQDEPWTLHFATRLSHTNRVKQISLTMEQCYSNEAFGKALGKQGVAIGKDQLALFREFVMAWIKQLQQVKDAVVSSVPYGWSAPDGTMEGFCYGGRRWGKGGDKPSASPDPVLALQYTPKGKLDPWVAAAKMVTDSQSPERNAYIAASFAAPLVRFTGLPGLLISTYSTDSGIGKSTALKVGQAVWGHPIKGVQSLNDTANSVFGKIGSLQALPIFWDELKTEEDTNKFVNITFQLSLGKEKSRMGADAHLRDSGIWQTLLMSASNDSILDAVVQKTKSTTAGIYRVFEYSLSPLPPTITTAHANQLLLALNDNFGQAGLVYAKFLGENFEAVHKAVAQKVHDLETAHKSKPDERFWIGSMAVLLLGAEYANGLGLTQINMVDLEDFLITCLGKMRGELKDTPVDLKDVNAVSNVLQQYFGAIRARHLVVTNKILTGAGKPPKGSIKILNDVGRSEGIHAQVGREDYLVRISSTHFRGWLGNNGYSPHLIISALKDQYGARLTHGRLASGTQLSGFTEYLVEFDARVAGLTDLTAFD